MSKFNPYDELGIKPDATQKDIVKAYRKKARQHHPDHNPGDPEAVSRFHSIQKAFAILQDPQRKEAWDRTGDDSEPQPTNEFDFLAVLNQLMLETMNRRSDYRQADLVELIRERLSSIISMTEVQMAQESKSAATLRDVAGRLSSKDGQPCLMVSGLLHVAEGHERNAREQRKELDRLTKALNYLKNVTYRTDKPAKKSDSSRGWTNLSIMFSPNLPTGDDKE